MNDMLTGLFRAATLAIRPGHRCAIAGCRRRGGRTSLQTNITGISTVDGAKPEKWIPSRCAQFVERNFRLSPSSTRHVSLPVANAPVSILMRVGKTSGIGVGV